MLQTVRTFSTKYVNTYLGLYLTLLETFWFREIDADFLAHFALLVDNW